MDIKIPEVGESVHEALVARWLKEDGAAVHRDEPLCELETDKITLELPAEADGVLTIAVQAGETVKIGTVIGSIEAGAAPTVVPTAGDAVERLPLSPAVRKLAAEQGVDVTA